MNRYGLHVCARVLGTLVLVLSAACGDSAVTASQQRPDPKPEPPKPSVDSTSPYQRTAGDDWLVYKTKSDLRNTEYFWWFASGDVYEQVDLVPDPVFQQVVRIEFEANRGTDGQAPQLKKKFSPLDDMWYRWRMRYQPGWTTAGPDPAGHANSYKIAFWTWPSNDGRGQLEISNTTEYITGLGVMADGVYNRYQEQLLPGSAPDFGRVTTEWTDGEWWEFVVHYRRTSPTSAENAYWRRRLTHGGAVSPGPWVYHGYAIWGAPVPPVSAVQLGANKNKNNPLTMYIYWGPWEVVDGSRFSNPFKVPHGG